MGFRDRLESCEIEKPRNLCVSAVSAFIFSLAWWIAIDAASKYSNVELPGAYHAPGAIGTLAFILVNIIPNSALRDDFGDRLIGRRASFVCLFFAFLMAFSCVIAACWILFGAYVAAQSQTVWPGVAIFLQNVLLCASSFIFRFGRKVDD